MKILFREIKDRGDVDKERALFDVVAPANTKDFLVARTKQFEDKKSFFSRISRAFWMTGVSVGPGDRIVLYTKGGEDRKRPNRNGTNSVLFYWHQTESLWNEEDDTLVLAEVADLSVYFASEFTDSDEETEKIEGDTATGR